MGALLHGMMLNLGLLMSPGVQNMFILEQGVLARRVLLVCIISSLCDVLLLCVGVFGFGKHLSNETGLMNFLILAGCGMLLWHGAHSLRKPRIAPKHVNAASPSSLRSAIALALSFSLLNPGVYLDTVMLVGVTGSFYDKPHNLLFWAGASIASSAWFFSLGYMGRHIGARLGRIGRFDFILRQVVGIIMIMNAILLLRLFKMH